MTTAPDGPPVPAAPVPDAPVQAGAAQQETSVSDPPGWPADLGTSAPAAGSPCVDVPAARWDEALTHALGAGYVVFDWLSAVDEPEADPPSVDVVLHVAALSPLRGLLLRTRVPAAAPVLPSATHTWAGAAWHERETHEMFGVDFTGFDDGSGRGLRPLLLPDGFIGTPWRKSFQLAARSAKVWPGAKEPGESGEGRSAPARRASLPPGVADPVTWGPRSPAAVPAADDVDTDAGPLAGPVAGTVAGTVAGRDRPAAEDPGA